MITRLAIWWLERSLFTYSPDPLTREQSDGLLSMLWQNAAFRNYIARRNAELVRLMAGGEGYAPEPRDQYVRHSGQREEVLLLGSKAKLAFERISTVAQKKHATMEATGFAAQQTAVTS